jgi:hypothetical protein
MRAGMFSERGVHSNQLDFLKGFEISTTSQTPSISDSATAQQRKEFLADPANRLNDNVGGLWRNQDRVLGIGDAHFTQDIKSHTVDNMAAYSAAGACAIGMEFLPQGSQPALDRYAQLKGNGSASAQDFADARQKVESYIKEWSKNWDGAPEDKAKAQTDGLMSIVDSAIDHGIRPVGLEPNISPKQGDTVLQGMQHLPTDAQSAFDTYTSPNSSPESRQAAGRQLAEALRGLSLEPGKFLDAADDARKAGFDFAGMKLPGDKPLASDKLGMQFEARWQDLRNRTWAEQTKKELDEDSSARMLIFSGAGHIQYGAKQGPPVPSVNERLSEKGIGTTVLQFAGGDFAGEVPAAQDGTAKMYAEQKNIAPGPDDKYPAAPDSAQMIGVRYTLSAQAVGVADKQFAVKIEPERRREADYVVHLRED